MVNISPRKTNRKTDRRQIEYEKHLHQQKQTFIDIGWGLGFVIITIIALRQESCWTAIISPLLITCFLLKVSEKANVKSQ